MLAYHVEWHLRDALAPLLFHDTDLDAARAERSSPVAKTEPSEAVKAKKATKRSADGHRVMSFAGLVAHLGTLIRNTMRVPSAEASLHALLQANSTPGGRLQTARHRTRCVSSSHENRLPIPSNQINHLRSSQMKTSD